MNKYVRLIALLLIDAILVTTSVYTAYLLRFDFAIRQEFIDTLPYVFALFVILNLFSFYIFKIYKRIWQYASMGDLLAIIKGALLSGSASFFVHHLLVKQYYSDIVVPRSIYPLTFIIIFLTVGGSRIVWRLLRDSYGKIMPHHRRALIVGAGEAGVMVVKELRRAGSVLYPVAFIDDNKQKQNYEVIGIPVAGTREEIPHAVKKYKIDEIIVAIPTASHADISDIIKRCKEIGRQIKIIPRMNDLINGKITINMLREVSVEDLLGREPVKVDMDEITSYLKGQVVLVTGAGGSIGSEICRQVAAVKPKSLLILGHGENSIYEIEMELRRTYPSLNLHPIIADVQARGRIAEVFRQYQPQVVFHAAAHKHVPLMESNPQEAIKNNVFGTKNVAECAHAFGAKRFVLISTDKAVNPTSVMGATKRIAEMILQNTNSSSSTIFTAVRFGNVLGSRGSVIPVFKKQIAEGGPVTVTHPEMIRYFMTIPEAVQLVIQAGSLATGGEVFILDMGRPVKIAELASDLIRLSGLEPGKDIQIIYTGLRPGEKLFEEILTNEEGASATKHDRIYVSRPSDVDNDKLLNELNEMEKHLLQDINDRSLIKRHLERLVSTYKSNEINDTFDKEIVDEQIKASLELVAAIEHK
ncbi:polysaccharide biosynthesis protein [Cohnella panacarvi]|uniref:polysaccharide biosynthesis protein n=1 Tax=Cohnella panacarvi TaxID=400776 RepID=UPI00047C56E1|nr:nucleoside-diphosphate sugar epimerase/dehydratase [Cohnella panacarvi]